MLINHYATTRVVGGGNDWNGFFRDIDAQLQATFVNRRKMRANKFSGLVRDIQVNAVKTMPFHLGINGARDDIAWR